MTDKQCRPRNQKKEDHMSQRANVGENGMFEKLQVLQIG